MPNQGRVNVVHAIEIELDTAGDATGGDAEHGFSLLIEKVFGLSGDLSNCQFTCQCFR